ncbi:aldehyde ferredoxin oxidoreductase family protein [Nitrospinota bacterium]
MDGFGASPLHEERDEIAEAVLPTRQCLVMREVSPMPFGGYMGKVLEVDLTRREIATRPLEENMALHYIGGHGFTSRMLYDLVGPDVDPLSPENVLLFAMGPLVGTIVPGACRWTVAAKSPLTGILGDGNGGGFFGVEFKRAGYDLVIIRGRASSPVYLWIKDDQVNIRDARHLWGKDTYELERSLRCELLDPDVRIAGIGVGGENLVKFATVIGDRGRAAGRCGMGAVMGSKNLKAVAVRGTEKVEVARPGVLLRSAEEFNGKLLEAAKRGFQYFMKVGSPGKITSTNEQGILGTRNYQAGEFEGVESISGEALEERFYVKKRSCPACPVGCNHFFIGEEGDPSQVYYGTKVEFAATGAYGSLNGNKDLNAVLKIHVLANKLGIDTITLGATLALATECYEKGLITNEDTDGLDLRWGDPQTMLELTSKVGKREGFGALLAEGSMRVAQNIGQGAENFTAHVKGMECPINDPRGLRGWGLGYAVSSRGGDHCRAAPDVEIGGMSPEQVESLFGTPEAANRFSPLGKGKLVKYYEELRVIGMALGMCRFIVRGETASPELAASLYNAVTGLDIDGEYLMKTAERIVNLERMFNVREGVGRKDDTLPKRFLEETLPAGASKGRTVELEPMLNEYYEFRGWEKETGHPKKDKLLELGLEDVASEPEASGKLGRD